MPINLDDLWPYTTHLRARVRNNNNNNTIWRGSVFTGEEPPPHSGELKHALPQAGGPTQSQPSRPMSSGHHISMEHRLRRKQLNSDANASNNTYLKEIQEKKEETFFLRKMKREKEKKEKVKKRKGTLCFEKKKKTRKNEKRAQRGTSRDGSKK